VGLVLQRHVRLLVATAATLTVAAGPFLFMNQLHPLLSANNFLNTPRVDQYFTMVPGLEPDFVQAAQQIRAADCVNVGLLLEGWEYQVWVLLPEVQAGRGRIEHVSVDNSSARLAA